MKSFSERNGYRKHDNVLQFEKMDDDLRVSIFNELYEWLNADEQNGIRLGVWTVLWHLPRDRFPLFASDFMDEMKKRIFEGEWFDPYDLIEFVAQCLSDKDSSEYSQCTSTSYLMYYEPELPIYVSSINRVLERERSGYRLVDVSVVAVTDDLELSAIDDAIGHGGDFEGARVHLRRALECLSKKPEPDFPNTVKEAISAVESAVGAVAGGGDTLGKALRTLKDDRVVHPALVKGWKEIYGFTSDEGGIRHASSDGNINVDYALAKYMLVSCSAFVNYLVMIRSCARYKV